jgi:hypothetical protein
MCGKRWERRTEISRLQVFIEIKREVTTTTDCQILRGAKREIVISTCNWKFNINPKEGSKVVAQQLIFTSRNTSGPNNKIMESIEISITT